MSNKQKQKISRPPAEKHEKMARPRNAEETRAALLAAARLRFARDGFEATNLRDIAADVGVNVALIPRYFGSKEGLFQAVISFERNRIAQAMQGPPEQRAERLLRNVLGDPAGPEHDLFVTLLRSSSYPTAVDYIRHLLTLLTTDLIPEQDLPDADVRADLVAALFTGIVVLRRLVGKSPLAEASAFTLLPYFQEVLAVLLPDQEAQERGNK